MAFMLLNLIIAHSLTCPLMAGNLKDSHYVREVYRSLSHVGERFAQVGPEGLGEAKLVLTRNREFTSGRKSLRQQCTLPRVGCTVRDIVNKVP